MADPCPKCGTVGPHSWGACVRAKGIRVGGCGVAGHDTSEQKRWDGELSAYRDARAQGIQPAGTKLPQIHEALDLSNRVGAAYDATDGSFR